MHARTLRRCVAAALAAATLLQTSIAAHALNIVWVSDNGPTGFSGPTAGTADDAFVTNLLWTAGHTVIRYNPDNASANPLPAGDLAALNTNDLIIIGRSIGSGAFANQQANSWNQGVTKPIIVCSPFLTRAANMGWFASSSALAATSPTTLNVLDVSNIKSAYLFEGVAFNGTITAQAYDEAMDRNTSITADAPQGGGVIYAKTGSGAVGNVICDWPAGATIRSGTNTLAGYRMFFACGSQEPSGGAVSTAGKETLSPMGEQVFLRAVLMAANNGVPPNIVYEPIVIGTQPTSLTNAENSLARFVVTLSQGNLPYYQWYSNGVAIPGATGSSLSLTATLNAAAEYYVIITNASYAATSAPVTLTVIADTTPPVALSARATSARRVVVYFDEPVDPVTATDPTPYYVDTPTSDIYFVTSAEMSGNTAVVLTLSDNFPTNKTGTLSFAGIRDRSSASNAASGEVAVSAYGTHRGNIVWVSDNGPIGFSGPVAATEDDVFTTNLLANAGYNVIRYNADNTAGVTLTAEEITALNTNDLIIIGRASGSGPFAGTVQASQWNTNITRPIIVMSAYLVRSTAMGWFTGDALPDDTQSPLIGNTNSSLYSLLFTGFAMSTNKTIDPFDRILDRSTSLMASPPVAGGTVIATAAENSANAIVSFPAGTVVRSGTNVLAGYRMLFCGGSRELNGANINTAGKNNFSAVGELIFERAVEYAIQQYVPPLSLGGLSYVSGTFSASFLTAPGMSYQIQYKTDLQSPVWVTLTNFVGDGSVKTFTDATADPARFYRATAQ